MTLVRGLVVDSRCVLANICRLVARRNDTAIEGKESRVSIEQTFGRG